MKKKQSKTKPRAKASQKAAPAPVQVQVAPAPRAMHCPDCGTVLRQTTTPEATVTFATYAVEFWCPDCETLWIYEYGDDPNGLYKAEEQPESEPELVKVEPIPEASPQTKRKIARVRTIAPNGYEGNPYVVGHANRKKLDTPILHALYAKWNAAHPYYSDQECVTEWFEGFVAWLEQEHGYFQLFVSDGMLVL